MSEMSEVRVYRAMSPNLECRETDRVRPYLSTGVGVRLSVGEPLEAKRPPTRTGIMRRLWGWLGQAWVASSEL